MSEQRTLRSKAQRALLWYSQGGKCARCGEPLGDDWEADHIIPWWLTHRTNVHEMQGLCFECNRKKGAKMGLRKHQAEMQQVCREIRTRALPVKTILVSVAPGGGKSALPQIITKELISGVADAICWVVPRDSLRSQGELNFVDEKCRQIFGHRLKIRADTNDFDPCRGTSGYITTYQAITANPKLHLDEFKTKRYILILDEFHHVWEDGPSHTALQPLVDRAAILVLMTGTPGRGDGKKIAFMPYKGNGTPGEFIPNLDDTDQTKVIRYTRRDALAEQAIIPIDFYHLDGSMIWVDKDGQSRWTGSIADEGKANVRDAIYTALSTDYAYQLLDKCLAKWTGYRATHPRSKMLVVAHGIEAAKDYVKHLRSAGITRVGIATSYDSADAEKAIGRFKSHDNAGALDILVTVAMAYEGLDVPSVTHLACLTNIRSRPWIDQMFARINRVDDQAGAYHTQRGCAFCPDDILMQEAIDAIKLDQEAVAYDATQDDRPTEPPGPTEERRRIVPLDGEGTRERASDLQGDYDLDYATTATWENAMRKFGLEGIPVHMVYAAAQDAISGNVPTSQLFEIGPPELPPSKEEDRYLVSIEKHIRRFEYENNIKPGTVNGNLIAHFGKSRTKMRPNELNRVWVYVQARYPLKG